MKAAAEHELRVVYRDVSELLPYANNSRTHSDAQVAQIAASLREFGWTNPILVDGESGIIAGHGRLLAARKLGQEQVPTIELAHLTDAQRRAYVIADNKLAELAGWDKELLAIELGDLNEIGFDTSLLGFKPDELTELLTGIAPEVGALTDEPRFLVLVDCGTEREQQRVFDEMTKRNFTCKLMS